MDAKWQALWFGISLVCFFLAAVWGTYVHTEHGRRLDIGGLNLLPLGLFSFVVVFFWTAWRAI